MVTIITIDIHNYTPIALPAIMNMCEQAFQILRRLTIRPSIGIAIGMLNIIDIEHAIVVNTRGIL